VVVRPTAPTKYRKQLRKSSIEVEEKVEDTSTQFKRISRPPRNEQIKLSEVQLVDGQGKLHPPMPLSDLLSRVDLKKNYVQLVAPDKILVKVFNKTEEFRKQKARKAAATQSNKSQNGSLKEIQMTWGVANHDLAHKLNKVRTDLRKGNNVDVVFAPKKGTTLPSPQERDAKVKEIMLVLSDCAKEQRTRTFERGVLTIHLAKLPDPTTI
jgi:translation initiation factor IF-3